MHLLNNASIKKKQEQVFKTPVNLTLPQVEKTSTNSFMENQVSSIVQQSEIKKEEADVLDYFDKQFLKKEAQTAPASPFKKKKRSIDERQNDNLPANLKADRPVPLYNMNIVSARRTQNNFKPMYVDPKSDFAKLYVQKKSNPIIPQDEQQSIFSHNTKSSLMEPFLQKMNESFYKKVPQHKKEPQSINQATNLYSNITLIKQLIKERRKDKKEKEGVANVSTYSQFLGKEADSLFNSQIVGPKKHSSQIRYTNEPQTSRFSQPSYSISQITQSTKFNKKKLPPLQKEDALEKKYKQTLSKFQSAPVSPKGSNGDSRAEMDRAKNAAHYKLLVHKANRLAKSKRNSPTNTIAQLKTSFKKQGRSRGSLEREEDSKILNIEKSYNPKIKQSVRLLNSIPSSSQRGSLHNKDSQNSSQYQKDLKRKKQQSSMQSVTSFNLKQTNQSVKTLKNQKKPKKQQLKIQKNDEESEEKLKIKKRLESRKKFDNRNDYTPSPDRPIKDNQVKMKPFYRRKQSSDMSMQNYLNSSSSEDMGRDVLRSQLDKDKTQEGGLQLQSHVHAIGEKKLCVDQLGSSIVKNYILEEQMTPQNQPMRPQITFKDMLNLSTDQAVNQTQRLYEKKYREKLTEEEQKRKWEELVKQKHLITEIKGKQMSKNVALHLINKAGLTQSMNKTLKDSVSTFSDNSQDDIEVKKVNQDNSSEEEDNFASQNYLKPSIIVEQGEHTLQQKKKKEDKRQKYSQSPTRDISSRIENKSAMNQKASPGKQLEAETEQSDLNGSESKLNKEEEDFFITAAESPERGQQNQFFFNGLSSSNVLQQEPESIQQVPQEVVNMFSKVSKQQEFFGQCKEAQNTQMDNKKARVGAQFMIECNEEKVLPLSTLSKIKEKKLRLIQYTLNKGLSAAFAKSISTGKCLIQDLYLENNHLKDHEFSLILKAFIEEPTLKILSYKKNEFGPQSLEALDQLLHLEYPFQMSELCFSDIKIKQSTVLALTQSLQTNNLLKRLELSLVSLNNSEIIASLGHLIANNYNLIDLNLSQTNLKPVILLQLCQELENNTRIRMLDLSGNSSKPQLKSQREIQVQIAKSVGHFLKANSKLQHLNLENMDWGDSVQHFIKSVRKSPSLLSIHLSHNQISYTVKERIMKKLKVLRKVDHEKDLQGQFQETQKQKELDKINQVVDEGKLNFGEVLRLLKKFSEQYQTGHDMAKKKIEFQHQEGVRGEMGVNRFKKLLETHALKEISMEKKAQVKTGNNQNDDDYFILTRQLQMKELLKPYISPNYDPYFQIVSSNQRAKNLRAYKEDGFNYGNAPSRQKEEESKKHDQPIHANRLIWYQPTEKKKKETRVSSMTKRQSMLSPKNQDNQLVPKKKPMARTWQLSEQDDCWLCQKYKYTIIHFKPKDEVSSPSQNHLASYASGFNKDGEMQSLKNEQKYKKQLDYIQGINPYLIDRKNEALDKVSSMSKALKNQKDKKKREVPSFGNALQNALKKPESKIPMLMASFTEWRGIEMQPLHDFCKRIDPQFQPLDQLYAELEEKRKQYEEEVAQKKKDKTFQMTMVPDPRFQIITDWQLSFEQKLQQLQVFQQNSYKANWSVFIEKNCQYKDYLQLNEPQLLPITSPQYELQQKEEAEDRFLFAAFIPPGRQELVIQHQGRYYQKTVFIDVERDLPPQNKQDFKKKEKKEETIVERSFSKEHSVFKDWHMDREEDLLRAFQADVGMWKVGRFVKSLSDKDQLEDALLQKYHQLTMLHRYLIAFSEFPFISMLDFGAFVKKLGLMDKKVLNVATLDRLFIQTNVELVEMDDNPDKQLQRFELVEILVRIVGAKWKDTGKVQTYAEGIQKLLDEYVIPFVNKEIKDQQAYREKYIWTLPINDILYANLIPLQKIHKSFYDRLKKGVTFDKIQEFCDGFGFREVHIKYFFCLCKMTVIDEFKSMKQYDKLQFVEFLEFIVRMSPLYFDIVQTKESQNLGTIPSKATLSNAIYGRSPTLGSNDLTDSQTMDHAADQLEEDEEEEEDQSDLLPLQLEIFLDAILGRIGITRKEPEVIKDIEEDAPSSTDDSEESLSEGENIKM